MSSLIFTAIVLQKESIFIKAFLRHFNPISISKTRFPSYYHSGADPDPDRAGALWDWPQQGAGGTHAGAAGVPHGAAHQALPTAHHAGAHTQAQGARPGGCFSSTFCVFKLLK